MNVLVVDDDEISLKIAANSLRRAGYDVATARDGEEALGIWCSPRDVVSEAAALVRAAAAAKSLALDVSFSKDLPTHIQLDAVRLRQILINLLGNAIKFTEAGTIRVDTEMVQRGGRQCLQVSVADTGIGISPEQLDRLFQPFSQVDSSMSRSHGGAGLGLAVSKRLARKLGGGITAVSELGKGSTFTLTVAIATEGQASSAEKGSAVEARKATESSPLSLANCHVLVLEQPMPQDTIPVPKDGEPIRETDGGQHNSIAYQGSRKGSRP